MNTEEYKTGIRKMQTAAGGPLFPWQLNTEWVNDWKFRTTPASRSRVLSGKGVETDKQYTERRKKEETKRTWRSDAADIAHGIGEGILALHPYTAIPYFGAKVELDFLNGTYGWHTALNASVPLFHLAPQAVGLREATNVALEDAANAGSKTARNLRVAREFNNILSKSPKTKEFIMPGLIGWAPKTKFKGYHASNENPFIPDFFREGWALRTHNAVKGIYIANGKTPGYGFLTKRKYVYPVETTFEKPLIQLGEVKGRTKNGIRNLIEKDALEQGADGIIFKGIADNLMQNLFIAKTLNPDTKIINRLVNLFLDPNAKQFGMQRPETPLEKLLNSLLNVRKTSVEEKVNPTIMKDEYLMLSAEGRALLYNAFIHGNNVPIIGKLNITNGLSDIAKTHLLENTVKRNIREFEKENLYIGDYYSKILKALENVKVGRYPEDYYIEARNPFEGFYVPDKNFISLRENNIRGEIHEGRHLIDDISSLTPRLEDILSKAFSDDFINLPKWELAPEALKKYKHMDRERVTTNRDARHTLLRWLNVPLYSSDFNLFKKLYNIHDDMLTFLNNGILTADTDEVIEAIESSNGYGKTYINYLRSNNKLTPEKINLFRQSMAYVGNYIPPIIGGTLLNQLLNIKEEKK